MVELILFTETMAFSTPSWGANTGRLNDCPSRYDHDHTASTGFLEHFGIFFWGGQNSFRGTKNKLRGGPPPSPPVPTYVHKYKHEEPLASQPSGASSIPGQGGKNLKNLLVHMDSRYSKQSVLNCTETLLITSITSSV